MQRNRVRSFLATDSRSDPRPSPLNDACISCYRITPPLIIARDIERESIVCCYRCNCSADWYTSYGLSEAELRKALAGRAVAA